MSLDASCQSLLHTNFLFFGGVGGSFLKCPTPFRFEYMWLKAKGFHNLIEVWWKSFFFRGTNSFVLVEKLKALKRKIKRWNNDVFGRDKRQKVSSPAESGRLGRPMGSKTAILG